MPNSAAPAATTPPGQIERQKAGFKRMGVLGDWDNPYLTMDFQTEADIVRALARIVANGHLVRGYKPVYWSVVGASALAEAEVEYKDKNSYSIDVRFPVADRAAILDCFPGAENDSSGFTAIGCDLDDNTLDLAREPGGLPQCRAGLRIDPLQSGFSAGIAGNRRGKWRRR